MIRSALLLWLALLWCPTVAEAQEPTPDERARMLFDEGVIAYDAGNFEQSLQHFENAYALSPRPRLLYNIATSADRLRYDQQALDSFEAYLEALPEADNREQVEARIVTLREGLIRQAAIAASVQQAENPSQNEPPIEDSGPPLGLIIGISAGVLVVAGVVVAILLLSQDNFEELPAGTIQTLRPAQGPLVWSLP